MSQRTHKREQFQQEKPSRNKLLLPLGGIAMALIAVTGWLLLTPATGNHQVVAPGPDGTLRFSVNDFSDGQARFYRYQARDGAIDFFIVKSHDGVIRTAFDSCDVCFRERKGYRQEGREMVCVNCEQRFPTEKVNVVKGGCNPAPLKRQQLGGQVVIAANDIERGANYFPGSVN